MQYYMLMKYFLLIKKRQYKESMEQMIHAHPGVAKTMSMKDYLVGGKIDYIQRPE